MVENLALPMPKLSLIALRDEVKQKKKWALISNKVDPSLGGWSNH